MTHLIKKSQGTYADRYYGLGEVSGPLNRNGRRFLLAPSDSMGYDAELASPLYKHIPFVIGFSPAARCYYGLYYVCGGGSACEVDFGCALNNYLGSFWRVTMDTPAMPHSLPQLFDAALTSAVPSSHLLLKYYFIHGPTVADVVSKFTRRLVGTSAPAPLWALGYLGSAMGYTDAHDAQTALEEGCAKQCEAKGTSSAAASACRVAIA